MSFIRPVCYYSFIVGSGFVWGDTGDTGGGGVDGWLLRLINDCAKR